MTTRRTRRRATDTRPLAPATRDVQCMNHPADPARADATGSRLRPPLCRDCAADCGPAGDIGYPDVLVTERWVAIQFDSRGAVLVIDPDGTVTTRFTFPAQDGPGQLPLVRVTSGAAA